jgi:DHA1 family multidrug resistance protein-like MFS transporter
LAKNPQNWSSARKLLVTFEICILNFGIYIGSSIYTPGKLSAMEEFNASDTIATLGLSFFVLSVQPYMSQDFLIHGITFSPSH